MRLFYDPNIDVTSETHQLSEDESKHIVRVLRIRKGKIIGILDGKGRCYKCEIIDDHPKRCLLEIKSVQIDKPDDYHIHIAIGPTKQVERIEWFVEKATEIGISEISLIQCKNGERGKIKIDRLERKAISAMKQSQRTFLPKINELTSFHNFIDSNPNGLIAHCYQEQRSTIAQDFTRFDCPILIGPEGDFTKEEINHALENGYKTITLGQTRLRTETAALYACISAKIAIE